MYTSCADPESFVRGGPTLTVFFFVFFSCFFFWLMIRGRTQIPLLAGHQRPASETQFKWGFAGGPMMAQLVAFFYFKEIWTSIAKEPYIFVIFQGGSGPPIPPSSGSTHVHVLLMHHQCHLRVPSTNKCMYKEYHYTS